MVVSWVGIFYSIQFSSVQLLSRVRLFVTPGTAALQVSLFITNSKSLVKLMSIKLVMPSNHLILCHPLILLPSIFPSINVFSSESVLCIRWPKYWNFSFNISPSNEYLGLISFRIDLISLEFRGFSRVFSNTTVKSINSLALSFLCGPTLTSIHDNWIIYCPFLGGGRCSGSSLWQASFSSCSMQT